MHYSYQNYAKSLPLYPEPEVFGLHSNAAITKNINESQNLLDAVLETQQQAGGADSDRDAATNRLANKILEEVPAPYDLEAARAKYPVSYEESMNSVLTQEL